MSGTSTSGTGGSSPTRASGRSQTVRRAPAWSAAIYLDFGHTDPLITLPVGGEVEIDVDAESAEAKIRIVWH